MRIGIMGALPEEVAGVVRAMRVARRTEVGGRTVFEGVWMGQEIVVTLSRVGKVAAAVTTALLLERFAVKRVIFTGLAGAIDPRLRVGDVVVADRLVQHDMDASGLPPFQRFEVPLLGRIFFEAALSEIAYQAAGRYLESALAADLPRERREALGLTRPGVYRGPVASGDRFVCSPEAVTQMRHALPAVLCTEMEGAAVAQVCHELGDVPCAILRVISDQADHGAAVDFRRFIAEVAEPLTTGLTRELVRSL